jgi:hypothetical protein
MYRRFMMGFETSSLASGLPYPFCDTLRHFCYVIIYLFQSHGGFRNTNSSTKRIPNTRKQHFGNWICFQLKLRRGRQLLCLAPLMELTLVNGPSRVGVSLPSPEDENRSSVRNVEFSNSLGLGTMDIDPAILRQSRRLLTDCFASTADSYYL